MSTIEDCIKHEQAGEPLVQQRNANIPQVGKREKKRQETKGKAPSSLMQHKQLSSQKKWKPKIS